MLGNGIFAGGVSDSGLALHRVSPPLDILQREEVPCDFRAQSASPVPVHLSRPQQPRRTKARDEAQQILRKARVDLHRIRGRYDLLSGGWCRELRGMPPGRAAPRCRTIRTITSRTRERGHGTRLSVRVALQRASVQLPGRRESSACTADGNGSRKGDGSDWERHLQG